MTEGTIEELTKLATKAKKQRNARQRFLYKYARVAGFTPEEARILSSRTKDHIDRLIPERPNSPRPAAGGEG